MKHTGGNKRTSTNRRRLRPQSPAEGRYDAERDYQRERDRVSDERYERAHAEEKEAAAYEKALEKARTLAATGDFSGYAKAGYTDGEIARMKAAYDAARPKGGAAEDGIAVSGTRSYKSAGKNTTGSAGQIPVREVFRRGGQRL